MPAPPASSWAETEAPRRARSDLLWLLPPLVLAVAGLWLLSRHHGLWYDELYTAEVAPTPLGELWHALITGEGTIPYLRDAPPSYNAPYYAVAHLWLTVTRLPADEWGLRLLSLAVSVAAVVVFVRAVARLADRRVALAAGLVVAVNPFVVEFSAEARGYGLALLATSVAALGLARWLDGEARTLLLYGAGAAAAGLFHWFALLVVGAFAVAAVALRRREALPVVAVSGLASVPALAVVGIAVANGVGSSGAEWLRGVGAEAPWLLLRSWSGRNLILVGLTVAAATVGILRARHQERVVAVAWIGVPVAVVTALELLVRPVFVDRYLLPATLGLAVLVALGITAVRYTAAALAVVLAVSAWATVGNIQRGPKDDVRSAVAFVADRHQRGEPVVAAARWDSLGLDHYARRDHPDLVADLVLPPAAAPGSTTLWVVRRTTGGVKGDGAKLEDLDLALRGRGMAVAEERMFPGRYATVLVQRWAVQASVRTD